MRNSKICIKQEERLKQVRCYKVKAKSFQQEKKKSIGPDNESFKRILRHIQLFFFQVHLQLSPKACSMLPDQNRQSLKLQIYMLHVSAMLENAGNVKWYLHLRNINFFGQTLGLVRHPQLTVRTISVLYPKSTMLQVEEEIQLWGCGGFFSYSWKKIYAWEHSCFAEGNVFRIRVNKLIVTVCISSRTQRSLFQR